MDSYTIIQVAVAVFLGNVMTLGVVKAYQRMKLENRFEWVTAVYFLAPLIATAGILTLGR